MLLMLGLFHLKNKIFLSLKNKGKTNVDGERKEMLRENMGMDSIT